VDFDAAVVVNNIRSGSRAFDYAGKYLGQGVREVCPAKFPMDIEHRLREAAIKAHEAIGVLGYSRSDFIVTDGCPVFLEINTLPGLTRSSLLPLALGVAGINMGSFLSYQILLAQGRYRASSSTS
jgi:D-alanine-D-alanine ligase